MGKRGAHRGSRGRDSARWIRTLPTALLVLGVVLDWLTPAELSAAPFYSAAPMVAAPTLGLAATVWTAAAACLADLGMVTHFDSLGRTGGRVEMATIATVAVLAVLINRLLHRSNLRLQSAHGVAVALQHAVLPQPPAAIGPLRIAARYAAAYSDAQIGGDLYAVQETPYGIRCIVGDVRGKGLGAIEAVTVVLGAFREAADQEPTLDGVAERLERALSREGERRANLDRVEGFTTALMAEIPPGDEEIRLVNRGHPAPLVVWKEHVRAAEPSEPSLPLGMTALGGGPTVIDTVPFPEGAMLLLHTDGVTEARDRDGTFFDPVGALVGRHFRGPEALLDALLMAVDRHSGGERCDDVALLAISREPSR